MSEEDLLLHVFVSQINFHLVVEITLQRGDFRYTDFRAISGVVNADSDRVFFATGVEFVRLFRSLLRRITTDYWEKITDVDRQVYHPLEHMNQESACRFTNSWGAPTSIRLKNEDVFAFHVLSHGFICAPLCILQKNTCTKKGKVVVKIIREEKNRSSLHQCYK